LAKRSNEVKVVRYDGATSNTLFEVLGEWEAHLKAAEIDIHSFNDTHDNSGNITPKILESRISQKRSPSMRGPSR
jgi:hypothetical protein